MAGSVSPDRDLAVLPGNADDDFEGVDVRALLETVKRRRVPVVGLSLIVVALLWRIQFLSHLYFRLDDFIDLDKAIQSPFDWSYLTYNGVGHLIIVVCAVSWLPARTTLFPCTTVEYVGTVSLAIVRLMRSCILRISSA